ncbi:MAG: Ig-like domain-containing protein [Actinomycetota bacterium]|nr:Ig-like domain-containing protein [Actinomycetota bacterium]
MRNRAHIRSTGVRKFFGLGLSVVALAMAGSVTLVAHSPGPAGAAVSSGYWLMATDGGVFAFGKAGFHGSTGSVPLNQPIVGTAATPSGRGYWMVAADGGIFTFGDAGFYGSMGGKPLNKPIVAMAPTRSGRGYWMVAADGGMFSFGDAGFYGSMGGEKLNKPVVDLAVTPTGRGYWMAATDGGIFSFGDAGFHGSTGAVDLVKRIHAMSAAPSGKGYWMVAGDGGMFAFGDAGFFGSAAGGVEKRVIDMAASATGKGYYVTTSEGQVLNYGDARHFGDTKDVKLNKRIVAMSAMNGNEVPVTVDDVLSLDEDATGSLDVLANDRDPDGGPLTLRSVGTPSRGTATAVGNAVLYRPHPDVNGTDSFSYTLADDRGETATGRVNVSIRAVDDKVAAVDDTAEVLERAATGVPVLGNDTGLGDGVKSVSVTGAPSHGKTEVGDDHTITYTPNTDYIGGDSFEYKITDADGDSSTARVRVQVIAVNDIPVANDDTVGTPAGKSLSGIDVQGNDVSPDGKRATWPVDPNTGQAVDSNSAYPTELGGTFTRSRGKLNYTPPRGVTGTDTFRYVLIDGESADDPFGGDQSNPATVRVNLGANGAPRIVRDAAFSVVQGATVRCERVSECLAQVVEDPEGDKLTFHVGQGPNAQLDLNSDGTFTYGPAGPPPGDSFTFTVDDGNQESGEGTVSINITPPPPPAQAQSEPTPSSTTTTTAGLVPFGPLAAAGLARWFGRRRRQVSR